MIKPEDEIAEVLARESAAWEQQDADALVDLHHPDMVSLWPPGPDAHDPMDWVWGLGRFDRERWAASWRSLFNTHRLVRNERIVRRISVARECDAGFAVVDVDTVWLRHADGQDFHWLGRACKVYAKVGGRWLLIMQTGLLRYNSN